ncbi:threonine ammonia-lyase [Amycolatopsis palatopharyngis]|uniref:threonine ammonia-lyase n=1 Tax=Amycolatopsis palatopharyngis TaxID=187982 RepID=UPI001FE8EE87|nr:pyridoxal-phosphate dependent enzyme [Amycolatopsis palatopharyngis]
MRASPPRLDDESVTELSLTRIAEASAVIDPELRNTPQFVDEQLCAALGRRVLVKVETLNPLRSFKGRGAQILVQRFAPGTTLVGESTGNFGQALGYAARGRGLNADVFMAEGGNPAKIGRMRSFGVTVHEVAGDARAAAVAYAGERDDRVFVEDGDDPAIAEGAGTIGVELLAAGPIDTVVLPIGDGSLITGVARWIKDRSPATRIIGVCAAGATSVAESWRTGRVISSRADTIAEGIRIDRPVPSSLSRMRALVDDIVLVEDSDMLAAIHTAATTLGLVLEPSGAAGLAAIAVHDLPGDLVATVLTGSNLDPALFGAVFPR